MGWGGLQCLASLEVKISKNLKRHDPLSLAVLLVAVHLQRPAPAAPAAAAAAAAAVAAAKVEALMLTLHSASRCNQS